ncbi:MAG: hypothetical protein WD036_10240 [Bauldia sp.]
MTGFTIFLVCLALGALVLWFGPRGWRTTIVGWLAALVPLSGEILDYLSGFSWNGVLDGKTAMWVAGAIGVLMIVFNRVNKSLYGSTPRLAPNPDPGEGS